MNRQKVHCTVGGGTVYLRRIFFLSICLLASIIQADERLHMFVETYCIDCHDSIDSKGEVNLEVIFDARDQFANDGRFLELLHRTLAEEEMPPVKKKQPSAEERQEIVGLLEEFYNKLAEKHRDEPGHVVMQRLTKQEYRNVIRDLTGGIVVDAGKYLPNEGGAGEGFNNVGEAQGMGTTQVEKFLEAARLSLRHLRANPVDGLTWRFYPIEPVDEPGKARLDAVNEILGWFANQQYRWARDLPDGLEESYGSAHGPYLEAAWRYRYRMNQDITLAEIAARFDPPLPPVPLGKWWGILSAETPRHPYTRWALAWRDLPSPSELGGRAIRDLCNDIVFGRIETKQAETYTFAPAYEISYSTEEKQEQVNRSAQDEGVWSFRIEIGDAKELFLVGTQGGDDNRGDYFLWHSGVFEYANGDRKPWHEVTKIRGANSGRIFTWGKYNDGTGELRADAFGSRPPGALKIAVPEGAEYLTVKAEIDKERTNRASIQVLVLKEKPERKLQSFYPGRLVFGGRNVGGNQSKDSEADERGRLLRRINIPAANRTKAGLNAERNLFANWDRTPLEYIGGPWDYQESEEEKADEPYHLTSDQILACAEPADLEELERLQDRLEAIAQVDQQRLLGLAREAGWEKAREGVTPPDELSLSSRATDLKKRIEIAEKELVEKAIGYVSDFAKQAWRRPVTESEMTVFAQLFSAARGDGLSYDSAIKQPLLAVLASPHFLFRIPVERSSFLVPGSSLVEQNEEQRTKNEARAGHRPLSGFELANRLSFFLWGSIPDQSLLTLAENGYLQDPEILRREAHRMLQDDRAASLATEFAGQVFGFTGFEEYSVPDPERFPQFTPQIRRAMIEEVEHFCGYLFRGDAPLTDLFRADYSFIDRDLARHYGIENFASDEFQKTAMPPERGGLAGMGLFLTKTSEPLRTSPVVRGVWIYESILGRELPSPPANIPAISQDETDELGRSIREQLQAHRADAGCASCHDKIDPLGISLEQFDPIGRWRTKLFDGSNPESNTRTKDGTKLSGAADLKTYLAAHQDGILKHITKKLLGYALGRSVGPGDKALLDRLAKELAANDYRFPWLVEEIVTSPQFTCRQSFQ